MKYVLFVAVIFACVLALQGQRCESGKDCKEGQCCITYVPSGFFFRLGQCKRLLKEGEKCMPDFLHGLAGKGRYFVKCPCQEGLECMSENEDDDDNDHSHSSHSRGLRCMNPDATEAPTTQEPTESEEVKSSAAPEQSTTDAKHQITDDVNPGHNDDDDDDDDKENS
ncbi:uncharacterized protein LOC111618190 [Centruroides sculpturatus]|uniref:uncharacterized protein LOC111618190 n=1 Tax=Centruroides sculpturatus TaxID=218467 RepID=UPI000C6CD7EC|nr:uncharacterized protein LOC111618190 [Centruroides sculpturatus]